MSGPSLEGLNIVYPPVDHSQTNFDFSNPINIPELDAQLDLWTNLAFQSDEPIIPRPLTPSSDDKRDLLQSHNAQATQEFDVNSFNFFNQYSIDPFLVPPATNLSLPPSSSSDSTSDKHVVKRARAVKKPVHVEKSSAVEADYAPSPDSSELGALGPAAVSATEDKRKRNTAASARFRAKKKEREAALEKKSKELETRVNELERECESLRRENGWLKGLVVGVTGASAGAASSSATVANVVSQGTKRKRPFEETPAVNTPPHNDNKVQSV